MVVRLSVVTDPSNGFYPSSVLTGQSVSQFNTQKLGGSVGSNAAIGTMYIPDMEKVSRHLRTIFSEHSNILLSVA